MARIAGVNLPAKKRIEIALTYIYGIGRSRAKKILEKTGIDPSTRVMDLTEDQVAALRQEVESYHGGGGSPAADPGQYPAPHRYRMLPRDSP
jgi:ribosomal protein S13